MFCSMPPWDVSISQGQSYFPSKKENLDIIEFSFLLAR